MRRDKRQTLEQIAQMRGEGKSLLEIAHALGLSKGYVGWLCYEHDIPKARKKHLKLTLRKPNNCGPIIGGEVRPEET